MKRPWIAVTFLAACTVVLAGQTKPAKPLEIYVVDPEGGKEALWVTPAGQAILIDTGSPGGRDTDRIMDVINELGIKKLDILLSTHYHVDHVGGLQELLKRIPVDHFYDHGETIEDVQAPSSYCYRIYRTNRANPNLIYRHRRRYIPE